jgi:hypothetical protein
LMNSIPSRSNKPYISQARESPASNPRRTRGPTAVGWSTCVLSRSWPMLHAQCPHSRFMTTMFLTSPRKGTC